MKEVSENTVSTRLFKDEITFRVSNLSKQIEKTLINCDSNHSNMGQHIDRITLKFSENTVDLSYASEGF